MLRRPVCISRWAWAASVLSGHAVSLPSTGMDNCMLTLFLCKFIICLIDHVLLDLVLLQVQGMWSDGTLLSRPSIMKEARRVFREEGVRAFWKGNGVTIVHRLPYSSINFFAYEQYKAVRNISDWHYSPGNIFSFTTHYRVRVLIVFARIPSLCMSFKYNVLYEPNLCRECRIELALPYRKCLCNTTPANIGIL